MSISAGWFSQIEYVVSLRAEKSGSGLVSITSTVKSLLKIG